DGAGLIFTGAHDPLRTYVYDEVRREIVEYNGSYYYVKDRGLVTGEFDLGFWEKIEGDFRSIATGLLLTEDAAITKSLVLGTEGTNNGVLRTANAMSHN